MNLPSAPVSPSAPSSPEGEVSGGGIVQPYEDRAAAAFGDDGVASPETLPGGTQAPAPLDEVAQRRAERRAQLDATMAEEERRVDAQQRRKSADEASRRAAAAEARAKELEAQLTGRVDPASLDEAGFFQLAKQLQIPPKKLAEYLQARTTDPELIAAQVAQRTLDPKLTELQQQLEAQSRELAEFKAAQAKQASDAVAMQRGDSMINFAQQAAAQAPHAARFLESYGEERFIQMALTAMPDKSFRPGWEQHTLDAIENHLADFAKIYAPPGAAPQQRPALPTPKNGAAKPMTTVSNTLAQSRASVVPDEGINFAALPYEERANRAFSDD